jgi:hypothetical protein
MPALPEEPPADAGGGNEGSLRDAAHTVNGHAFMMNAHGRDRLARAFDPAIVSGPGVRYNRVPGATEVGALVNLEPQRGRDSR